MYGRPESRVFWLTGMPGVGKTAVAGCLCHTRREVIAHHICKATNNDWRDPVRAVLSIAYQMSPPGYRFQNAMSADRHGLDQEFRSLHAMRSRRP